MSEMLVPTQPSGEAPWHLANKGASLRERVRERTQKNEDPERGRVEHSNGHLFPGLLEELQRSQQSPQQFPGWQKYTRPASRSFARAKHRPSGAVSAVCLMVTTEEEALGGDPLYSAVCSVVSLSAVALEAS